MKYNRKNLVVLLLSFLLVSGAIFAGDTVVYEKEKKFSVGAGASLTVGNISGDIKVVSWDKDVISVSYKIIAHTTSRSKAKEYADKVIVEMKKRGNHIRVKVEYEKSGFFSFGKQTIRASVDFEIKVPKDCNLDLNSVSGDVNVSEIKSDIEVSSVSGDSVIKNCAGNLDSSNVSGDLTIAGFNGKIKAKNVSGDSYLEDLKSSLTIEGVSSDIIVKSGTLTKVSIETVSGDCALHAEIKDAGSIEVETISGDLRIYLHDTDSASYYLKTFSGDLRVMLPNGKKIRGDKKLRGKVGSGDVEIELYSLSGDLTLVFK